MAFITYYTASANNDVGDYRLSVSQEQIARKMDIGTSWQYLRLGMRAVCSHSDDHVTSADFAFGLTSGTSSLYSGNNTTHFVGLAAVDTTLNYYTNFNPNYESSGSARILWKTGSLTQTGSGGGITYGFGTAMTSSGIFYTWRTATYLDIIKSTTDPGIWEFKWFSVRYQTTVNDASDADFYSQLLTATMSLGAPWTTYYKTTVTLPVSESTHGYLDTFNLYWNNATVTPLHISDVAIYRFN